ncbi:MAG: hypothetical protein AAFU78_01000 [Cyanobacteria bacterium J06633_2]
MPDAHPQPLNSLIDELLADLNREHELVNVIIRGCIDHRWALGEEERAIAQAMVFNAFEAYLIERGMTVDEAGEFCEQHIDSLMRSVLAVL